MSSAAPSPTSTKKPVPKGKAALRWARRVAWIAAGLVLVATIVVAWLPKPVPVDLAPVRSAPMQVTIDEAARTRVKDRFVISAPLGGNVLRLELRPGDTIKAGAVLARIIPVASALLDARTRAESESRVALARAAQRQAEAVLNRARLTHERAEHDLEVANKLAASNVVAREERARAEVEARVRAEELASARFAVQMANHQVSMAETALRRVTVGRDQTESFDVPAPTDGVVLRVMLPSGGVVAPGTPLLELGDPAALEVVSDVLTADAVQLRAGARVELDRWGGEPLRGHIRLIEPSAFTRVSALGIEEQRVSVIIDLDDPREKWSALGDGFRLDAHLVVWESEEALQVPSSAVFRQDGGWVSYVVVDERAELRPVELGQRSGPSVEVKKGLSEGERVIAHPSDQVRPGARVAPR